MTATRGPEPGLVSILVPCLGPLASTRRCLKAVLRHSRRPWELIAVTRGAGDATASYLAGVADAAGVPVAVVAEPGARGLRAAWARGLREARGEYVALLGPTTVVTDAWLEQLIALAGADPAIGMAGPAGPVATPKMVSEQPVADPPGELDAFAARWRAARRGKWSHEETLAGHCLLLKRGVVETLRARRRLGGGLLRPDRLSRRVRRAGFRLALAHDLYVHQDPPGRRAAVTAGAPAVAARRCRVSLTMIVRNEEDNLPACLTSAEGLFDEIVVVDTGSTDRTAEIARSFGARVFDFVWVDDFAAARNAALARATGDYAFWLDADDRLEPPQRERLKALLDGLRAADAAYVVRCSCDPDPRGGGATVVDHVRLFPVREDVRWGYAVHEQILPALRRAGVPVRWSDVVVRHVGYNDPALRRRKLLRDRAILEAELAERPDDPFVLFNLGNVAMEVEDPRAALEYLRRSLAGSAPSDSIVRKLHALIARAHQVLGEPEAALAACGAGLADEPDDAELLFRKAVLHRNRGEPAEAESCWRRVLTLRRPEKFASVDEGIYGHLTRRNLAALAAERGDRAEAARLWAEVLGEVPGDAEARANLDRIAAPAGGR
jgi:glycosyltransferase involved in cell wall biosynthesis